jgi:hypothetical protein
MLVFSSEAASVAVEAADRRDARAGAAAGAGRGKRAASVLDLPDTDEKAAREGGELVN